MKPRIRTVALLISASVLAAAAAFVPVKTASAHIRASSCPWLNESLPIKQRVQELVSAMTLPQMFTEMHAVRATTGPYAGYEAYTPAQPALCIPALIEEDGPAGVHYPVSTKGAGAVTQLPAPVALSSAWDPALAQQYGAVNGAEHWGQGMDLVNAPTVNIQRDPRWGRNFEAFSEDPFLSAALAVADTQGLQSQHVIADVKHYVAYNQETGRKTAADDDIVSDRVLREIYMPSFQAATTQGHAGAVMCSFNGINGTYACQNPHVLHTVLDGQWGFRGFVRSDGAATRSTAPSVNAGEDQEGVATDFFSQANLTAAVNTGQVSVATINQAVGRIFTSMFRQGLFNNPPTGNLSDSVSTPGHVAFARQVAEQGTVLLKNAGILPLGARSGSIAVIGPDGTTSPLSAGGGSTNVISAHVVSPLQGIESAAPQGTTVTSYSGTDPSQAAAVAQQAQVAIVFAAEFEQENADLPDITLPSNQDAYIQAVAAANPNTIVVLNTGGPVAMPWLDQVGGVLEAWYPGQEDGNALADILFGTVDPSGHLPETFPASLSQTPTANPCSFPGCNGAVHYSEGLDVGYRWYDTHNITPLFPFGYGLSYTSFSFSNLSINPVQTSGLDPNHAPNQTVADVTAQVTNTGSRAGSDVAQLYLGDPAAAGEPPRQLRGFDRIELAPGQSQEVTLPLTAQDLAYWNGASQWTVAPGSYQVYVGDSSALASLPLTGSFQVGG